MTSKSLKYKLDSCEAPYGEDRVYEVSRYGHLIGFVETEWLVSREVNGLPVKGWGFRHNDGRRGEGRTREAAVKDALAKPVK